MSDVRRTVDRTAEILAEAARLARPALQLREGGDGPLAAVWVGGEEHRVSVDIGILAGLGLDASLASAFAGGQPTGSIDVFAGDVEPTRHPRVLANRRLRGAPLHATRVASFPPLEALCAYGGPVVDTWLSDLGATRANAGGARVRDSREGTAVLRAWQASCPLYVGAADVLLGGWHMLWPEDDTYDRGDGSRLVVWTFRDAEPWLELWTDNAGRFSTIERIT